MNGRGKSLGRKQRGGEDRKGVNPDTFDDENNGEVRRTEK